MKEILVILILTIFQFICGYGCLRFFIPDLKKGLMIPISVITGIMFFSIIPFLWQLLAIPITFFSVWVSLLVVTILLNLKKGRRHELISMLKPGKPRFRLYEIPSLLLIAFIVIISLWRSFYLPPTPRDLTSGPEVIAEYTVKEKTMINSVFTVDLSTTNNQYKPPFITSLQVIYKYAGFPFGQVWLGQLFVFFLVFLFHSLNVHRVIAGILLVFFLAIPEMYAYTFMALFDYPNAILFFLSCWCLFEFFSSNNKKLLWLSGLLMGFATYIRSETLVFAAFLSLAIMWYHIKNWDSLTRLLKSCLFFLLPAFVFYLLPVVIYNRFYLPEAYQVSSLVNKQAWNPLPLFQRFVDTNFALLFSRQGILYYGYFVFIFLIVLVLDLVFSERINRRSRNWLFAVMVIYFGYPLLGHLLPLLDIHHSTKRGFFKLFPLMLLYMGSSNLFTRISKYLAKWEEGRNNLSQSIKDPETANTQAL